MPPAVGQDATQWPTRDGIGVRLNCDDDTVWRSTWWWPPPAAPVTTAVWRCRPPSS